VPRYKTAANAKRYAQGRKMRISNLCAYVLLSSLLAGCNNNKTNNIENGTEENRDLSNSLSFSELIYKRMNNDIKLDNSTVLINSELQASFSQPVACAEELPCTDDIYNTDIVEPVYQGSNFECSGNWFRFIDGNNKERLIINLEEHTEFFTITEFKSRTVNFYAQIKFIKRQAWCSDQVNYGLEITLLDGEESYLLEQFQ
jgi:hypothetical protein